MKTLVTRTYLEMRRPGDLIRAPLAGVGVTLERVHGCPVGFHRFLYREVGRHYHWHDRLTWTDEQTQAYLDDPRISIHVLYCTGAPAGYFELRREDDGGIEIAYFGLLPEYIGRGLGKMLLSEAVDTAWKEGASRVWLHTCTLDDPAAMPNYLKRGFVPVREEQYETEL
jgi:GNAT superfamily N-acetyltransferase